MCEAVEIWCISISDSKLGVCAPVCVHVCACMQVSVYTFTLLHICVHVCVHNVMYIAIYSGSVRLGMRQHTCIHA